MMKKALSLKENQTMEISLKLQNANTTYYYRVKGYYKNTYTNYTNIGMAKTALSKTFNDLNSLGKRSHRKSGGKRHYTRKIGRAGNIRTQ